MKHSIAQHLNQRKIPQSSRVRVTARVSPELKERVDERLGYLTEQSEHDRMISIEDAVTIGLELFLAESDPKRK